MIERRRHFDHIHAAPIEFARVPDRGERARCRETARDRGSRTRRVSWIERVDIESEIARARAYARDDLFGDLATGQFGTALRVHDVDAAIARRGRADADLDRAGRAGPSR